jgi:hypothetical protein
MYTTRDLPQTDGYFSNDLVFYKIVESIGELFNVKKVFPDYRIFAEDEPVSKEKPKTSYDDNVYTVNQAKKKQLNLINNFKNLGINNQ